MYKLDKNELALRQESRGRYAEGSHWYAVMVHHGREERVRNCIEESLADRGVDETFLPLVQPDPKAQGRLPKARPEFLFRSYLFLRCAMNDEIYMSVCDHSSVYRILGRGHRIPTVLDDEEICRLRRILRVDCRPEMVTRRNIGASARIVDGLMAGVQGRVIAVNSKEVKLEVSFSFLNMGTGVAVIVPRTNVRIQENSHRESSMERMYQYV